VYDGTNDGSNDQYVRLANAGLCRSMKGRQIEGVVQLLTCLPEQHGRLQTYLAITVR
jgi:hypothetical protein